MAGIALLLLDLQVGILERYQDDARRTVLSRAGRAREAAAGANVPTIYVRLAFRPGGPEVSVHNRLFAPLVGESAFLDGHEHSAIHPEIKPIANDIIVVKKRSSAFSGTDLEQITRALRVDHLVLMGVATSGSVLSTVRDAADRDFTLTVLRDGCADHDDEVHRSLCDKVFPPQARVTTVAEWAIEL